MAITTVATALKAQLNAANPNTMADMLRAMSFGDFVRQMPCAIRNKATVANPYALAAVQTVTLPDDAKAHAIFRAVARAGTGTQGELAVQAYGATPTAGQIAVAPNGDIATAAADAWTSIDVTYLPESYDVVEITLPVATNAAVLPSGVTTPGAIFILEAEALTGTTTGKFIVIVPSNSNPGATKEANLNLAKTQVLFKATDAVTSCRLKLAICKSVNVDTLLTAASNIL